MLNELNTQLCMDQVSKDNLNYLEQHASILKEIPYLPNVNIRNQEVNLVNLKNLYDYLIWVFKHDPNLFAYFDLRKHAPEKWLAIYNDIARLNTGGFGHGESAGGLYKKFQNHGDYYLSRRCGYLGLIQLLHLNSSRTENHQTVVDILAGNGTFSRIFNKLYADKRGSLSILGVDVSESMVADAMSQGLPIHRASSAGNLFARDIADAVISAYGTHHVAVKNRAEFVNSAYGLLKNGGRFVIQDFLPESNTGKWYSEVIHRYREGGHFFTHFTEKDMEFLLSTCFDLVDIKYVYDPFVMHFHVSETEFDIKRQFYAYLINLFSLKKLLPDGHDYHNLFTLLDPVYWDSINMTLQDYFSVDRNQLSRAICADSGVQKVSELSIETRGNQKILIAPRIAIAGVAIK